MKNQNLYFKTDTQKLKSFNVFLYFMSKETLDLRKSFNQARTVARKNLRSELNSKLPAFAEEVKKRIIYLQEIIPDDYKSVLPFPSQQKTLVILERNRITINDKETSINDYIEDGLKESLKEPEGFAEKRTYTTKSVEDQYEFLDHVQTALLMYEKDLLKNK